MSVTYPGSWVFWGQGAPNVYIAVSKYFSQILTFDYNFRAYLSLELKYKVTKNVRHYNIDGQDIPT